MSREEIALRIFCALVTREEISKYVLFPDLDEKQMRQCFELADVFLRVAHEEPAATTERTR